MKLEIVFKNNNCITVEFKTSEEHKIILNRSSQLHLKNLNKQTTTMIMSELMSFHEVSFCVETETDRHNNKYHCLMIQDVDTIAIENPLDV